MLIFEIKLLYFSSTALELINLKKEKAKKMEFHFNFDNPTISKNVGAFLNENFKTNKELLNRILIGKKLQYGDANLLLKSFLTAH